MTRPGEHGNDDGNGLKPAKLDTEGPIPSAHEFCLAHESVSLWKSALQEGRDTACALRYRHDFYGAGGCTIDDEVSANGPEQNRKGGEILALVANARGIANGVKGVE